MLFPKYVILVTEIASAHSKNLVCAFIGGCENFKKLKHKVYDAEDLEVIESTVGSSSFSADVLSAEISTLCLPQTQSVLFGSEENDVDKMPEESEPKDIDNMNDDQGGDTKSSLTAVSASL